MYLFVTSDVVTLYGPNGTFNLKKTFEMSNNMGTIYEPNTKPKVPPRTRRLKRQNALDLLDDISKSSTSGYLDDGHFNSRIDRTPSFSGNFIPYQEVSLPGIILHWAVLHCTFISQAGGMYRIYFPKRESCLQRAKICN